MNNTKCQLCNKETSRGNRYVTSSGNAFHKECKEKDEKDDDKNNQ
mgnify:CR=1 FL=1